MLAKFKVWRGLEVRNGSSYTPYSFRDIEAVFKGKANMYNNRSAYTNNANHNSPRHAPLWVNPKENLPEINLLLLLIPMPNYNTL